MQEMQREALTFEINRALDQASELLDRAERLKEEFVAYTREAITMIKTARHLERVLLMSDAKKSHPKKAIH